MAATLLLDGDDWDITLDASGNIALATDPYSLAQDAASAIKTFLGEVFYDTTVGVPYGGILGKNPPLALLKAQLAEAAETVPGVASAAVFLTAVTERGLSGQVQVVDQATGQVAAANFSAVNPQGGG